MKILSESGTLSHHQDVLGSKQNVSMPLSVPTTSDTYATLTSVVSDTYDKQELNIIFDSLLTGAFPDPNAEVILSSSESEYFPLLFGNSFSPFSLSFKKYPFVHFSLFPTATPLLKISPARFTPAPTLIPHGRGSGVTSSSP